MLLRAMLAFLLLPAMVGGVAPWLISRIPGPVVWRTPLGWAPLAVGGLILVAAVVSFYRRGRGTLAPWDPPTRLVVQDLYRFNRNPMYIGVALLLVGWALIAGGAWSYTYAALVPLAFHLRVVLYEEREIARRFPGEWEQYRRAVPRWGVRLSPYRPRH